MGLRVSDFDHNLIKTGKIVEMNVNPGHETTITLEFKDGTTQRLRVPAGVMRIADYYAASVLVDHCV